MKNYDLYQLREEGAEEGNMTALKQYTLLDRARLLEEVGKFGFMCDWNDFKVGLRIAYRSSFCVLVLGCNGDYCCRSKYSRRIRWSGMTVV